jgi:hypothetical protein
MFWECVSILHICILALLFSFIYSEKFWEIISIKILELSSQFLYFFVLRSSYSRQYNLGYWHYGEINRNVNEHIFTIIIIIIIIIQGVRSKYKQNWINHLERMDNIKLPKHIPNYKSRGRRERGRPRKRWQRVDAGIGQMT